MMQPSEENDRYNNSSGVVSAKLSRVFQNYPIYATTPFGPLCILLDFYPLLLEPVCRKMLIST